MTDRPAWWEALKRRLGWNQLTGGHWGFFLEPPVESVPEDAPDEDPAASLPAPATEPALPPALEIRVGAPQIVPRVSPLPEGDAPPGSPGYATSFIASWRPVPPPPEPWITFLREAPFGTQAVSARELLWDGRVLSVQRVQESEIEAFARKMDEWVEYANQEYARWRNTPEEVAAHHARERASRLQERLRR